MEDRLEPLLTAHAWALPPRHIVADLDALMGWTAQARAAPLARIRELHVQGIFRGDGATSAVVWLRHRYRMSLPTAWAYVRLAAAVDAAAPDAVREAVAEGEGEGEVSLEQARVIVDAIEALPRDVELRDLAGKELVRLAGQFEPEALRAAGETILRVVDPDAADEVERQALERAEAGAHERRGFTVSRDTDCDREPRWCDAHHVKLWAAGGPTSSQDLALLCGAHHGEVHRSGGWTMYMAADGHPTFIPPPTRRPATDTHPQPVPPADVSRVPAKRDYRPTAGPGHDRRRRRLGGLPCRYAALPAVTSCPP